MTHKSVLIDEVAEFFRVSAESSLDSAIPSPFYLSNSHISFAKRAAPPAPLPLRAKKLRFFAFRGRASLFPLLAKNQRSHYCSLDSDFLHHEAGEFLGASHGFNSDSAIPQNLVENSEKIAESNDKIQFKKPLKSFCYFWLSPKVESPLPLNPNLPSNADSANLLAMTKNKDFTESTPILIDATLGLGGHSERLLDENPTLKIIGIDKDKIALEFAKNRLKRFGARFSAVQGSFATQIKQILRAHKNIYGILADLGISSPQVDNLERGFSVKSSVLDMRMDLGASLDAKFVLNNYPKDELARIFRDFGEIKGAEKIANLIAESRRKSPIKRGEDLCKIVEKTTKWRDGIHPATLVFQAIRIEVNNELGDLGEFLANIAHLNGTKVAIISFHSLEDRLVKRAFKAWSADCVCSEGAMKCECGGQNRRGEIITKKPITPSAREVAQNHRARSAKMRCFKFK